MKKIIITLSCIALIVSLFLLAKAIKLENKYYNSVSIDYSDLEFKDLDSRKKALKYYSHEEQKKIFEKTYGKSLYLEIFRSLPRDFDELCIIGNKDPIPGARSNPWSRNKVYNMEEQEMLNKLRKEIGSFDCSCCIPYFYYVTIFEIYLEGNSSINLFKKLEKVVPAEILLEKCIDICVGATTITIDGVHLQDNMRKVLIDKLPLLIKILNKKTNNEVKSFWFFIFDAYEYHETDEKDSYRNPIRYGKENNETDYKNLYDKLSKSHPRLAQNLQEAWNKVIENSQSNVEK